MRHHDAAVDGHLPLRPVEFQILLSLSGRELHGYGIIGDAKERGEGAAVPGLATLYRALRRLTKAALIEEAGSPAGAAEGEVAEGPPRQTFRITDLGRRVAAAEARRLEKQVRAARANRLFDDAGS